MPPRCANPSLPKFAEVSHSAQPLILAPVHRKLTLFYLSNDVLQTSKRKGDEFCAEFRNLLPGLLEHLSMSVDLRPKIARVLDIWDERLVFKSDFIASLRSVLAGNSKEEQKPVVLEEAVKLISSLKQLHPLPSNTASLNAKSVKAKNQVENSPVGPMLINTLRGSMLPTDLIFRYL